MQVAGILARDIHALKDHTSSCTQIDDTQRAPPPKGVIRYGLQVNLSNCGRQQLVLKAEAFPTGSSVDVELNPSLRDIKNIAVDHVPDGYRSKSTKESLGFIAHELKRLRSDMPVDELRASDSEDLLARRARKCWFSAVSFNTEWILLPCSQRMETDPECASLGDVINFGDRVVVCQASTFGGARYALGTCHSRDLGLPEGHTEHGISPILRRLDLGAEEDRPVFSEWYILDCQNPRNRGPLSARNVCVLKSTDGEYLTLKLESSRQLEILTDITIDSDVRVPNYFWNITPVQSDGLQKLSWANHYSADGTIPLPVENYHPKWFESNIAFTTESYAMIVQDDGSIDLGIQELLLVEDVLNAFFGISGEFIEMVTEFPNWKEYDLNQNTAKPVPRFTHIYHTFVQTHDPQTFEKRYFPVQQKDPRAKDISNEYDSTTAIDESLRAMTDKIMTTVHAVSLIRHVAEHHLEKPTTRTNQALGAAMKYVLKELESKVSDLHGFGSDTPLSLQRLWSLIHPAKPSLNILGIVASNTYGVQGLQLINILNNIRTEECPNDSLQSMLTFIVVATSQPLESMLNKWVYGGILDDPCGEFFIAPNPRLQCPETPVSKWLFWDHRFLFISQLVPKNFSEVAHEIYEIGKAWRVIEDYYGTRQAESFIELERNCPLEIIALENLQLPSIVKKVHDYMFKALHEILVKKENLLGLFQTLQAIFFHSKSDYLADFFEISVEEMESPEPHLDALEKLFRRAISTSILCNDPNTKLIRLSSSRIPMATMSRWADSSWNGTGDGPAGGTNDDGNISDMRSFSAPKVPKTSSTTYPNMNSFVRASGVQVFGESDIALIDALDTFTDLSDSAHLGANGKLSNQALGLMCDIPVGPLDASHFVTPIIDLTWPLHLVIDTTALVSYQNIFRTLLMLKYIQLRLHGAWKSLCQLERYQIAQERVHTQSRLLSYCLQVRQLMSQFFTNLMAYLTEEVLEPAFHQFAAEVSGATTFFDLLSIHRAFLTKCMYECLLTRSDLYRKLVHIIEVSKMFVKFADEFLAVPVELSIGHTELTDAIIEAFSNFDNESNFHLAESFGQGMKAALRGFMNLVYEISRTEYGAHTGRLLFRLDCNETYFSNLCIPVSTVRSHLVSFEDQSIETGDGARSLDVPRKKGVRLLGSEYVASISESLHDIADF